MDYISIAKRVLNTEIEGITYICKNLDNDFNRLVTLCDESLDLKAKIILLGIGKSGQIAQKLSSTLSSTGSRATFLHPVEALHGDLGIIQKNDICLAFSYSGETEELINLTPAIQRLGIKVFSITSSKKSSLAQISDYTLQAAIPNEACPFKLAPTTTTTATLALGDALAICLMEKHQFSLEDYSRLHPGGAIGNTISLTVKELMRKGEKIARINQDSSVTEAVIAMCKATSELCIIEDNKKKLVGILTTGDLKRGVIKNENFLKQKVTEIMITLPKIISFQAMAIEALSIFKKNQINSIPVIDDNKIAIGVIDLRDMPKFKVI